MHRHLHLLQPQVPSPWHRVRRVRAAGGLRRRQRARVRRLQVRVRAVHLRPAEPGAGRARVPEQHRLPVQRLRDVHGGHGHQPPHSVLPLQGQRHLRSGQLAVVRPARPPHHRVRRGAHRLPLLGRQDGQPGAGVLRPDLHRVHAVDADVPDGLRLPLLVQRRVPLQLGDLPPELQPVHARIGNLCGRGRRRVHVRRPVQVADVRAVLRPVGSQVLHQAEPRHRVLRQLHVLERHVLHGAVHVRDRLLCGTGGRLLHRRRPVPIGPVRHVRKRRRHPEVLRGAASRVGVQRRLHVHQRLPAQHGTVPVHRGSANWGGVHVAHPVRQRALRRAVGQPAVGQLRAQGSAVRRVLQRRRLRSEHDVLHASGLLVRVVHLVERRAGRRGVRRQRQLRVWQVRHLVRSRRVAVLRLCRHGSCLRRRLAEGALLQLWRYRRQRVQHGSVHLRHLPRQCHLS